MNKFKAKNLLVTGGTGFVGSHLVEDGQQALIEKRETVICDDDNTYQ